MPQKDGWDVWIEVDGIRREEYQEKVERDGNKHRVTCFIASEVDKVRPLTFDVVRSDIMEHVGVRGTLF